MHKNNSISNLIILKILKLGLCFTGENLNRIIQFIMIFVFTFCDYHLTPSSHTWDKS